ERRGGTGLVVSQAANSLLNLRIKFTDRNAQHGARLEHACSGAQQGQVLIVRNLNESIKRRIMKSPPPISIVLVFGFKRTIVGRGKIGGERGRRRHEVRAHSAFRERQRE